MPDPEPIWRSAAAVDLDNRGLNYGDGLFETMLVRDGVLPFEARHRARLSLGCERLGLRISSASLDGLFGQLHGATQRLSWGVAKLVATRVPTGRGYGYSQPDAQLHGSVFEGQPWEVSPPRISSALANTRLAIQPLLAGVKHLNRLEQVMARAEFSSERYPELLVRDMEGRVVEGVMTNVFVARAGRLATPRLGRCGVSGVARAVVCEALEVEEQDLTMEDVVQADELFFANSVRGVLSVALLDTGAEQVRYTRSGQAETVHTLLRDLVC